MRAGDLADVQRIADVVHADFPERLEVLAERLALFPAGCFFADGGYVIAYPARRGEPPALDTLLHALPAAADALHVHDIALLPAMQGQGFGGAALQMLQAVAAERRLAWLSLVAVHGTGPYWTRFGFREAPASSGLATYGAEARYMVRATAL
jgi:GNAT superfamily N-acetyltransferase